MLSEAKDLLFLLESKQMQILRYARYAQNDAAQGFSAAR